MSGLTRILHQTETFMAKALRGEAVVLLPRTSNNAGHGSLRLARRVKCFQFLYEWLGAKIYALVEYPEFTLDTGTFVALNKLLKRFHAMFGIRRS